MLPKKGHHLTEFPFLGSGKLDFMRLVQLVQDLKYR
jgi:hypothetical protein